MNNIQSFILQQQKFACNFRTDSCTNESISYCNSIFSASSTSILDGTKNPLFFVPKLSSSGPASTATRYSNAANLMAVISRLTRLETGINIEQLKLNCRKFLVLKEAAQNSSRQLATEYSETLETYHSVSKELSALAGKIVEKMDSGIEVSDFEKANLISQLKVASDLLKKLSACREKMSVRDSNIQMMSDKTDNPSDMALAAALTVILIKLGSETSENELKNQLDVFKCSQKSLQETMAQKAKEFDDRMHCSKLTQKVMKIVGIAVGVGLQVLGLIGAGLSGGTSFVLSLVGTIVLGAVFLTDKTINYFTGVDPIEWLMNKAANAVINGLAQAVTSILQECGLNDEELAKKIGQIVSVIAMTVAVMALTALSMFVGGKVVSKFAKPVAEKAVNAVLRNMKKIISIATSFGQLALTGGEAAAGVVNGYFISKGDQALANFKSAQASVKALENLLNNASSTFNIRQKEIAQLTETLSSTIQQVSEISLQMSTQMRV